MGRNIVKSCLPAGRLLNCLIVAITCLSIVSLVRAQCANKDECANQIREYEKKVSQLQDQKNTLSSQIGIMDNKIFLTGARIKSTEITIEKTSEEIGSLGNKITDLNSSLDFLTRTLLQKIVQSYKNKSVSAFDIILDSENAVMLENKVKYMEVAQNSDRRLAFRLQQTKSNFQEQKDLRETKKQQLEELQVSLAAQKKDLDVQKVQKQALLTQTNSDQSRYQTLLSQALSEFQAIERAIGTGSMVGPVKKGDPIALVGNSGYPGCSTGAHLHFEVRQNGTWTNPLNFLSGHSLHNDQEENDQSAGSGSWDWPLSDPIEITQNFGNTPWSWRYSYSGGIHTGIDMISKSSDVIRAPSDGTLYTTSQNCSGATIKIKYIDHGGGIISYYLHVQ
ncbi:hypothetical protein A2799_01825 [Candidatus Roizmanbacteria bacterium RIFCSPHIGHO2_01_FULL_39_24]|uniref:M23ase beta-sheet core domain-containing protein n=1 Tax=Candidatus Roizmanbacteria bacterium RIFCSPHIGHO2_01_FULL_39_24 TaxID=1802032 RepID=A0A1F7GFU0_9BACT|nr:MAG: hypothetical protein A2799_01825 [Candidatus Roizmanbacteria bacterium RIFCSPHIGHO2_01_FULL_39_24]OGK49596.1 MAG: hypothetical protein A3A56_03380 [Candidatus Roizmanbacteria bacterium RIFCSPLOWO2_01_FULL_40_32]